MIGFLDHIHQLAAWLHGATVDEQVEVAARRTRDTGRRHKSRNVHTAVVLAVRCLNGNELARHVDAIQFDQHTEPVAAIGLQCQPPVEQ